MADEETIQKQEGASKKAVLKKKLPWIISCSSLAIALGIGGGFLAHRFFGPTAAVTYVAGETDDINLAKAKYEQAKASGTPLETALKPSEMVNLAMANYDSMPSTKAVGIGEAISMSIGQVIQSIQIKNGEHYFEESNSIGLVNLYDRMYQEGDTTTCYWGSSLNYSSNQKNEMTNEQYEDLMGRNVSDSMTYIISKKTAITKESNVKSSYGPSKIVKENDGYTVELELSTSSKNSAVANYVKQMKNISGLTDYPYFYYCHLTFHLTEDLIPLDYTSYEKYNATKSSVPLPVDIEGKLTTKFFVGETYEIPSLQDETQSVYKSLD